MFHWDIVKAFSFSDTYLENPGCPDLQDFFANFPQDPPKSTQRPTNGLKRAATCRSRSDVPWELLAFAVELQAATPRMPYRRPLLCYPWLTHNCQRSTAIFLLFCTYCGAFANETARSFFQRSQNFFFWPAASSPAFAWGPLLSGLPI